EGGDDAILHAADADAALPAGVVTIAHRFAGFGIRRIHDVVLVDIDAAGPPELGEDLQQLAVLVEFLNAVVPAVADIKMALAVHRQAMRHFELAAIDAMFA